MTNQSDSAPVAPASPQIEADRQLIVNARAKGPLAMLGAFVKLSGPGWLQSAMTLGGGSLSGSLYLGVLAGMGLLWLQPLAMVMGVIMLSSIAYVTLSTGQRPFAAINRHINPVLGWGWVIAVIMANLVWCMPQFALAKESLQLNLIPQAFAGMEERQIQWVCAVGLFVTAGIIIWFYDSGSWGIKIFEFLMKIIVGVVVASFFAVVIKMFATGTLSLSTIVQGLIPDFGLLAKPAVAFRDPIAATGAFADYWTKYLVKAQQDVMITSAATAVGINMTMLLPYSMLAKGWNKDFRGLAIFDLATALFVPFVLATGCVVISAASQFHAIPQPGLVEMYQPAEGATTVAPPKNLIGGFKNLLDGRLRAELKDRMPVKPAAGAAPEAVQAYDAEMETLRRQLPPSDLRIAAMLVNRNSKNLSTALEGVAGPVFSNYLFGLGAFGMGYSTIIILMLANGFAFAEMMGRPDSVAIKRIGAFMPALTGAAGIFLWTEAAPYLAVPTSMFGMVLLPVAYWTFFFMMNSPRLMGPYMPRGGKRLAWNVLMFIAAGMATFGAFWSIYTSQFRMQGFIAVGIFVVLAAVGYAMRKSREAREGGG